MGRVPNGPDQERGPSFQLSRSEFLRDLEALGLAARVEGLEPPDPLQAGSLALVDRDHWPCVGAMTAATFDLKAELPSSTPQLAADERQQ
jgi:hypothetical protein